MERDRQGVMRFFSGNVMKPLETEPTQPAEPEVVESAVEPQEHMPARPQEIVDGDVVQEVEPAPIIDVEEPPADASPEAADAGQDGEPKPSRRRRGAKSGNARAPKDKKTAKPRGSRRKAPVPANA
jgi:hypothetical protein